MIKEIFQILSTMTPTICTDWARVYPSAALKFIAKEAEEANHHPTAGAKSL
jgi:hypothetical protein